MGEPKYSTDPEMDAALQLDAEYLEAMGEDPGMTLDDLDDDYDWASPADMGAQ